MPEWRRRQVLRDGGGAADKQGMRHHCTQCLTEVLASGRQAPSGEFLCYGCYLALWGPSASDALREICGALGHVRMADL